MVRPTMSSKTRNRSGALPATIRAVLAAARRRCEREMAVSELDRFFELSRDIFCVIESDGRIRRPQSRRS